MKKNKLVILLFLTIICALCALTACTVSNKNYDICKVVFYYDEGGKALYSVTVAKGHSLPNGVAADEPSKTGYIFKGWRYKNGEEFDLGDYITQDTDLYAVWEAKRYEVAISLNVKNAGETILFLKDDPMSEGDRFAYGSFVTARVSKINTCFEFEGWYDENNKLLSAEHSYTFKMPEYKISLTAKFKTIEKFADFYISSDGEGGVTVTGYKGNSTVVVIPEGVTAIGNYAFDWMNNQKTPAEIAMYITDIILPQGLKTIGENAFAHCSSLKSIDIPQSVEEIGAYAFSYCKNLQEVSFSKSCRVSAISNGIFYSCTSLSSIDIPKSVKSIGSSAFYLCNGLSQITIPDSVLYIKRGAFYMCGSSNAPLVIKCQAQSKPAGWEDKWYEMGGVPQWGAEISD